MYSPLCGVLFLLSDPTDKDVQVECTHEHSKGDVIVGECDD